MFAFRSTLGRVGGAFKGGAVKNAAQRRMMSGHSAEESAMEVDRWYKLTIGEKRHTA
jgi:hypothetical protein